MHPILRANIPMPQRGNAFALYSCLEHQPNTTARELAAICGKSRRWATLVLAILRDRHLVTAHRDGRLVRYQLRNGRGDDDSTEASPDAVAPTSEELPADETASWRETLAAALLSMSPEAFERLCMRLLRESGFDEVTVTGRAGDGGIDGRGIKRLDGLISFPILFQCKRYTNNVSAGTVRDFRGAMAGRADRGLILTTGGFTGDAEKEATRDGVPPIDLIDGELLMDRLKELGLGVSVRTVEVVEVDTGFFDSI